MNKLSEQDFTGFYDCNGRPIFIGDTVEEGCNGLVCKVIKNPKCIGGYGLEGCGPGYTIDDSEIEWTVIKSIHEISKEDIKDMSWLYSHEDIER